MNLTLSKPSVAIIIGLAIVAGFVFLPPMFDPPSTPAQASVSPHNPSSWGAVMSALKVLLVFLVILVVSTIVVLVLRQTLIWYSGGKFTLPGMTQAESWKKIKEWKQTIGIVLAVALLIAFADWHAWGAVSIWGHMWFILFLGVITLLVGAGGKAFAKTLAKIVGTVAGLAIVLDLFRLEGPYSSYRWWDNGIVNQSWLPAVGVVLIIVGWMVKPKKENKETKRAKWVGIALIGVGLASFIPSALKFEWPFKLNQPVAARGVERDGGHLKEKMVIAPVGSWSNWEMLPGNSGAILSDGRAEVELLSGRKFVETPKENTTALWGGVFKNPKETTFRIRSLEEQEVRLRICYK